MQAFDKMWETPRSALAVSVTSKQKALAGPAAKFPVNFPLSPLSAFCVGFLVGSEARLCHLLRNSANRPVLLERSCLASLTCRPVPANPSFLGQKRAPRGRGVRVPSSPVAHPLQVVRDMGKGGYQFHRISSPFLGSQKLQDNIVMGRGEGKEGKPPTHRGVCLRRGAGAQTGPLPGCVASGRHVISLSPAPHLEVAVGGSPGHCGLLRSCHPLSRVRPEDTVREVS